MTEKPKRPLSGYMIWLNATREQIKRENPGIKVTEIAKRGGELWRAMKDKSEWETKAAKCKDDYTKAVREYEANGGGGNEPAGKKRGKQGKKPAKKSRKAESEEDEEESE